MKRSFLIVLILFAGGLYTLFSQADYYANPDYDDQKQSEKKERTRNRLLFGGNLWMSFGSSSYIEVSPLVGYMVTPRLAVAGGPVYIYENYRDFYQTSTYGGRVLANFSLLSGLNEKFNVNIGDIILHVENEFLNVEPYDIYGIPSPDGRVWIDNLLVGGGILLPVGRGGISFVVLWDVTQHPYSYHVNPIIRLGVLL